MNTTLIITTYNWPEALDLVIESTTKQSCLPNQVIIADDGSGVETREVVQTWREKHPSEVIHCWQEDRGFRLSKSRNNAIAKTTGDYIIMIDGDMVLHKHFIRDHLRFAEKGYFVQGWRAMLTATGTKELLRRKKIPTLFSPAIKNLKNRAYSISLYWLQLLAVGRKTSISGTKGCNMAFWRQDVLDVNGFNQDFEGWGKEDNEFALRLRNSGILRKRLRHGGVAFHLYHEESSRTMSAHNAALLHQIREKKLRRCINGLQAK
jgi:glycosyltransferase involved in cell wall biosynthesis